MGGKNTAHFWGR